MKNIYELQTTLFENLNYVRKPNEVVEVRILRTKTGTVSGYYDDYSKIAGDIKNYIGKNDIYFTLNPVNKDLIARSSNRLTLYSKSTTSDNDIRKISYILIDLDPVRASGISSSENEKNYAYDKCIEIYNFLLTYGWADPIISDSGNGYHLLYAVDLENNDKNRELLKQFLATLDQLFSDQNTHVDKTTFNPARIVKLYGTKACKGDSIPDRPHRWSGIISKPKSIITISWQQITEINSLYTTEPLTNESKGNDAVKLDVEELIKNHDLGEYRKSTWNNAPCYALKICPFNDEHDDWSACIIQFSNGAICVKCHHDSCSNHNWATLKAKLGIETVKGQLSKRVNTEENEKETASDVLLRLTKDLEFFSDELMDAYVKIPLNEAVKVVKVKGDYFRKWLIKTYYEATEKAVSAEGLNQAINVLESVGIFSDNSERTLSQRVGKFENDFYYDLYDGTGMVVKISDQKCELVNDFQGIFNQKGTMSSQVKPKLNGSPEKLLDLVMETFKFKSENDAIMYAIYLATCYIPDISHPALIIHGQKGAAKSTTMRFTRALVDPSLVPLLSMPKKIDDLAGTISKTHMICFDNLATINSEISDLLCMAVTGGGYTKRKLYTDDEEIVYNFKRCICLNGINVVATESDLLDRSILIELDRIPQGDFQTDDEINQKFEKVRADIIGGCLNAVAQAKAIYPTVKVTNLNRMADFMQWGYAVAEVMGIGGSNFVNIYNENQKKSILEAIEAHPVACVINVFMANQTTWVGSVKTLLDTLNQVAVSNGININHKLWPKAPKSLSSRLNEVKSNLESIGISFDIRNVGTHKQITIVAKH